MFLYLTWKPPLGHAVGSVQSAHTPDESHFVSTCEYTGGLDIEYWHVLPPF